MFDREELRLFMASLRIAMDNKMRKIKEIQWLIQNMDMDDKFKQDLKRIEEQYRQLSVLYIKVMNTLFIMD